MQYLVIRAGRQSSVQLVQLHEQVLAFALSADGHTATTLGPGDGLVLVPGLPGLALVPGLPGLALVPGLPGLVLVPGLPGLGLFLCLFFLAIFPFLVEFLVVFGHSPFGSR